MGSSIQRPILDNGRKKEGHRPLYATPEFLTYHYYYFYQGHPFVGFPSFVPQCYRIEFSIAPILIMTFFVIWHLKIIWINRKICNLTPLQESYFIVKHFVLQNYPDKYTVVCVYKDTLYKENMAKTFLCWSVPQ